MLTTYKQIKKHVYWDFILQGDVSLAIFSPFSEFCICLFSLDSNIFRADFLFSLYSCYRISYNQNSFPGHLRRLDVIING